MYDFEVTNPVWKACHTAEPGVPLTGCVYLNLHTNSQQVQRFVPLHEVLGTFLKHRNASIENRHKSHSGNAPASAEDEPRGILQDAFAPIVWGAPGVTARVP